MYPIPPIVPLPSGARETYDGPGAPEGLMDTPHIITITELRRRASHLIEGPVKNGVPVFVTQRGYVAAVLLSQEVFRRLASGEGRTPRPSGSREDAERTTTPAAAGLECFGPLPRGTLFETPWNLVDAETAAFFMEDGIPVRPHLRGWTTGTDLDAAETADGGES
jgi:prevent-host-death family protein